MTRTRTPPGPPTRSLLGHAAEYRRDPTGFLTRLAERYGPVASYRLGPRRFCLLTDPADIERVLVTATRQMKKPALLTRLGRALFGHALTGLDGAAWLRQRRLATPAFRPERLAAMSRAAEGEVRARVAGWIAGPARPIDADLVRLVLQVYGTIFFGPTAADLGDVTHAIQAALRAFGARVQRGVPIPDWMPTRENRDLRDGMRTVRAFVRQRIRDVDGAYPDTVAAYLIRSVGPENDRYATDVLCDELAIMWGLGAHQTAIALAWLLYLLATHTDVAARMVEESRAAAGPGGLGPLTAGAVEEALRLYPPFPSIVRESPEPFEAGGYRITAGTVLLISPWVMHRDPRFFAAPTTFRPERWSSGFRAALPRMAYLPFGAGPRACIAAQLAREVLGYAVIALAERFRLDVPSGVPVEVAAGVTLGMRGGLRLGFRPREQDAA